MTDSQFESKRFEIISDYLSLFNLLDLTEEIGVSVSSSTPGIYHVFIKAAPSTANLEQPNLNLGLTHQYSMSDSGLKNLAKSLKLSTIKRLYIDARLKSLEFKMIKRSCQPIDPLNFENCH